MLPRGIALRRADAEHYGSRGRHHIFAIARPDLLGPVLLQLFIDFVKNISHLVMSRQGRRHGDGRPFSKLHEPAGRAGYAPGRSGMDHWLTASTKLPQHIHSNAEQTTEKQVNYGRVTCFDSEKLRRQLYSQDPN